MGAVRHFTPHGLAARPAGAFSHAPPVPNLATPPPEGGARAAYAPPSWPWRAMAASALLHAGVAVALTWWDASAQHTAPNVAVEMVFLPGESAGAEAPSGMTAADVPAELQAQPETQVAEAVPPPPEPEAAAPAEPPPEPAPQPTEVAAVEPVVQPAEIAPPPELIAPMAEEILPEPAPIEPVQALPPPPAPRPVIARSKPVERKPPVAEAAPAPTPAAAPIEQAAPVSIAAATPAPTAATAAPPSAPAEPSEPPVIHEPRYRHPPTPPRFPPRALELHQQGTVVVRALVAPDGSSGDIIVWRSSGYALLDAAALRAVRDWAFEPASVGGRRIASWVEVPVRFAIR